MGDVAAWTQPQAPVKYNFPSEKRFRPLTVTMVKWFAKRGIKEATLVRNRVQYEVGGLFGEVSGGIAYIPRGATLDVLLQQSLLVHVLLVCEYWC